MEAITTSAMIGSVVGYLVKTLKENRTVQDFFNDFTDATVRWIRPLFLKDDNQYEKIIEDLLGNKESKIKKELIENTIASHLETYPDDENYLKQMYSQLQEKKSKGIDIGDNTVINSVQTVIGNTKGNITQTINEK